MPVKNAPVSRRSRRQTRVALLGRTLVGVAVTIVVLLSASCGTEVVDYKTLHLLIKSDPPPTGAVDFIDIVIRKLEADDKPGKRIDKNTHPELFITVPQGRDMDAEGYRLEMLDAEVGGRYAIRAEGQDKDKKMLTVFSGVLDTTLKDQHEIRMKVPGTAAAPDCDKDKDGVKNCDVPGCCAAGEASDCHDDNPEANPFANEDKCKFFGNGIDEDCDGKDTPAPDTDKDGVKDCQEIAECGAGAEKDKDVYKGAVEVCDGKDNDCNTKIDDLPYTDIDGKKHAGGVKKLKEGCGVGVCQGGEIACSKDNKSLVCTSASKKAKEEDCLNDLDDDCDGIVNNGCSLLDIDGDGVKNTTEIEKCKKNKFAQFHAEFGPTKTHTTYEKARCCAQWTEAILKKSSSWKKGKAPDYGAPAGAGITDALLMACDFDCDGKIEPCEADDKDGDGVPAGVDCNDKDPTIHGASGDVPAAPEKCGDSIDQDCIGGDEKCTDDKDGDGYNAKHDCKPDDKAINPGAAEICNGIDDDCDGIADDGNAEAKDAVCGDEDGECGKVRGTTVCKHWSDKPSNEKLDCHKKAYDAKTKTCVGCYGDQRPKPEICDYKDNDCDGTSDEDFTYKEEKSGKSLKVNAKCDGIGECGSGTVECHIKQKHATCSTDPDGSKKADKTEVCDNKDNDCDGTTDETLTSVNDSTCLRVGACKGDASKNIKTVCKAGKWTCDYAKVAKIEFDKDQKCTAGEAGCHCPGLGTACFKLHEFKCDGVDNDCSGKTDEDFYYSDTVAGGKKVKRFYGKGETLCGTGVCDKGKVVCNSKGTDLTCSTLVQVKTEICDYKDNDCNGLTDDAMTVSDSNCKLLGVCTKSNVKAICKNGTWECDYSGVKNYEGPTKRLCGFTDTKCKLGGSIEKSCDALDNDCDGKADDDFDFEDIVVGGKKAVRKKGEQCGTGVCSGGKVKCTSDKAKLFCDSLSKQAKEICDYKDNDCDGLSDENYTYTEQGGAKRNVGQACKGVGVCGESAGKVECVGGKTDQATCSTDPNGSNKKSSKEICDDKDNNCNKIIDEDCNTDGDQYCTDKMQTKGNPKTCPKGGGDCNDVASKGGKAINPGVSEICDGIDNDCNSQTDETFKYAQKNNATGKTTMVSIGGTCGLGACTGGKVVCNGTKGVRCTTVTAPGHKGKNIPETRCDDIDNDCDGVTDEGCDDDGDNICDVTMFLVGKPKVCPLGGGDCNDNAKHIHPGRPELCNNIDDNCKKGTDEGCDDDGDNYCDSNMVTVGKPKVCPNGGGDCNDSASTGKDIHPTHVEWCDDKDQDCDKTIDEGCDTDGDGYCDVKMAWKGGFKTCPKGGGDCNDELKSFNPAAKEVCDNKDQDCDKSVDEGCDNDADDWCDSNFVVVGKPKVCPKGGGDCADNDGTVRPDAAEVCNSKDDDCDKKTDVADSDLAKNRPFCEKQSGVCKGSRKPVNLCVSGKWNKCSAGTYATYSGKYASNPVEKCDGFDNDCSGAVDDNCDRDNDGYCDKARVVVGKPPTCKNGGGDCNDNPGAVGKSINPGAKELCSTLYDDNCNGADNDLNATGCTKFYRDDDKDGFGTSQTQCRCYAAAPFSAKHTGDCNDGSGNANTYTYTQPSGAKRTIGQSCAIGACTGGKVVCDGFTATCSSLSKKKTEICDGKDNDCDGKTDESPSFQGFTCSNKGVCKNKGIKPKCVNGAKVCDYSGVKDYEATEKTCDGKNNDCDDLTDEGSLQMNTNGCKKKGVCKSGTITMKCQSGTPTCDYSKVSGYQGTENACDAKDNDCDGKTDESFPKSTSGCSKKGVCAGKTATMKCQSGKLFCDFSKVKDWQQTETKCDNKDNDCNGTVDQLSDMSAPNDCVKTPHCPANKVTGLCAAGKWTCKFNGVLMHMQETKTKSNSCTNGIDDDCDGKVDGAEAECQ